MLKYFGSPTKILAYGGVFMSKDNSSLEHTIWNYKYYIVFAPKYRRQVIYRKIKKDTETTKPDFYLD